MSMPRHCFHRLASVPRHHHRDWYLWFLLQGFLHLLGKTPGPFLSIGILQLHFFHYRCRSVTECHFDWYLQPSFWYRWKSVLCTGNSTWQDYLHAKSNRQTTIVRRKYCQMWSQLSWLAGWRIFCSNMNHMPLRWHLFQLKLEGVDESPILPSCYRDIRDNRGYQLRLKKIACCIFKGWLAYTGCRERQRIEWQQNMRVFQIRKLFQWNDIILNHVNYAMEWHICKNIQTKQKTRQRWKFVHFVHQGSVGETFYPSIMSIRSYFKPVDKKSLFGEALQISTGEVSSTQVCVARQLIASMQ